MKVLIEIAKGGNSLSQKVTDHTKISGNIKIGSPAPQTNYTVNIEEPKWKLKNPIMKVPSELTGLQRRLWIVNWKKENIK